MNKIFRNNNFDMIRLMAAFQVAVLHISYHFKVKSISPVVIDFLGLFPGVPIFFFVSGFLISKSFENNPIITEYAKNRILRIYPSLILCTLLSIFSVYLTRFFANTNVGFDKIIALFFGQVSIFQFYNPDFMRSFGTGVLNGSLWTITVELQFYITIPILYWLVGFGKKSSRDFEKLVFVTLFFLICNVARAFIPIEYREDVVYKIFGVSFVPWVYMFLVGVIFQRKFNALYRLLSGRLLYILPVYFVSYYISIKYLNCNMGNSINPLMFLLLALTIFSFAYSYSSLSRTILRGNDFSYGVYIYHIPVVNIFIWYGFTADLSEVAVSLFVITLLAVMSWFFIEKPCLRYKKHPLNKL